MTGTTAPGGVETGPPVEADGADGRRWTVTPLVGGQWRVACRCRDDCHAFPDGPLVACCLTDAMVRALGVLAEHEAAVSSTTTKERPGKPPLVAARSTETLIANGLARPGAPIVEDRAAYAATALGRELAAVIDGATA